MQPMAWAIIHGGKDVENRTWTTEHRGEIYIHASNKIRWRWFSDVFNYSGAMPSREQMLTGGIIGKVILLDIIENSKSKWAMPGKQHWLLARPEPCEFIPVEGELGFLDYELTESECNNLTKEVV